MAKGKRLRGWRKIAAASWGAPDDPQIYGDLEVDATPLLEFIDRARELTGQRVTVTHLVGRALAHAYAQNPDLNGRIYRGRFIPRDSIDIFFIATADGGAELSGVKIEHADQVPAVEIARELGQRVERIRSGEDAEFGKSKSLLATAPLRPLRWLLRLAAWLTVDLDKDLPAFGLRRQSFGSALVTSVGMFGIGHAYAPLSPYYRVPLLVLVGEVAVKPVAVQGQVVVRPMLNLAATIDHRYLDGFHAARMARAMREYCHAPARFEPPLD